MRVRRVPVWARNSYRGSWGLGIPALGEGDRNFRVWVRKFRVWVRKFRVWVRKFLVWVRKFLVWVRKFLVWAPAHRVCN